MKYGQHSPEELTSQLTSGMSFKKDIWDLGILLFQMCALRSPFEGSSVAKQIKRTLKGEVPKIPAHFDEGIQYLIEEMLCMDPDLRITID